ncbi:hypothetical protein NE237_025924 [Protea cynaroides]|uniref:Uncharacterized protein n=1 Tax=Protea cynaroides TaxID=273540 RepID=A0A9Q0H395_9MAGN|nr:hypothetical protein NE237_025924 [Protea cynaroides]
MPRVNRKSTRAEKGSRKDDDLAEQSSPVQSKWAEDQRGRKCRSRTEEEGFTDWVFQTASTCSGGKRREKKSKQRDLVQIKQHGLFKAVAVPTMNCTETRLDAIGA